MTHLRTTQNPQVITPAIRSYGERFIGARLPAGFSEPIVFVIVAICAIGLLITLNIIFGFSGAVPSMEQSLLLG